MSGTIVAFARAPERGAVKTRLAAALDPERTLALYRAFLHDTLVAARTAGARVILAHTPSPPFLEQTLADDVVEQRGTTFGARFDAALADARTLAPTGPLVLVGADTPHVPPAALRRALDLLDDHPTVLGPSTEGGFYLLGFQRETTPVALAFDEDNEAVAVARALPTPPRLLEPSFDVDLPGDLVNLVNLIEVLEASDSAWVPRRTARTIADLGIGVVASDGTRGACLGQPDTGTRVGAVANSRSPSSRDTRAT